MDRIARYGFPMLCGLAFLLVWPGCDRKHAEAEKSETEQVQKEITNLKKQLSEYQAEARNARETAAEATRDFEEYVSRQCRSCNGTGRCQRCSGTGKSSSYTTTNVVRADRSGKPYASPVRVYSNCTSCSGKGTCSWCRGTGQH